MASVESVLIIENKVAYYFKIKFYMIMSVCTFDYCNHSKMGKHYYLPETRAYKYLYTGQ